LKENVKSKILLLRKVSTKFKEIANSVKIKDNCRRKHMSEQKIIERLQFYEDLNKISKES